MKKQLLALSLALVSALPALATANVAPGYISDNARTQGDVKAALEQMVLFSSEQLGGAAETTLTISGGSVTPPAGGASCYLIDTSGGSANLDDIVATNIPDGRLLIIGCANPGSNPVTVRHSQGGSIPLLMADAANFVFAGKERLIFKRTGSTFVEIGRFYGDQVAHDRTHLGLGTAAVLNEGTSSANVPNITDADTRYAKLGGLSSQAFNVAGSPTSSNAVNKTTADATYAALAGLSSQAFSAASPSIGANVVNKTYADANYGSIASQIGVDQTITASTEYTLPHSFGAAPLQAWIQLVNTSAEGNYSVGDVIDYVGNGQFNACISHDATNVYITITSTPSFQAYNKSTGAALTVTNAKWKLRAMARKL